MALKDYGYFTHIRVAGKPVAIGEVSCFQASVRNGQLVYDFRAALPAPVDPASSEVAVSIHDESYFVEVSLDAGDPIRFDGMAPGKCSFAIREGDGSLIAMGIAPYQVVTLSCPKAP